MYAALSTQPDILFEVAAHSHYNLRPFTSLRTSAKRVLLNLKSGADFRLHFATNSIGSVSESTIVL
jgi:hypothetical protein